MRHLAARHRHLILPGLLAVIAVLTSLFVTRNIDFQVYWHAAGALTDHSHPLYGMESGYGFPMHYRYPPATYLLLWPFGHMPLYWAGAIWMLGAWAVAAWAATLMVRAAGLRYRAVAVCAACAYMLAYVVLALRSGNVQPYVIAMVLASLALSESRRVLAAVLLALAITFKIWPVFFLPWFLRRNRRPVLIWLAPALLLLWLAPLAVWGWTDYLSLLRQWALTELQSAAANSETWYFPGQSLRGILLRYLTASSPWIKGFPDIHVFSLPPSMVVHAWQVAAAAAYAAVCALMLRAEESKRWIWDGLSFALFTLLEPFCLKSGMISLGPAVLVAAAQYGRDSHVLQRAAKPARWLFMAACALAFTGAIVQYRPALRLLLALGLDFYSALLLSAALSLWALRPAPGREQHADRRQAVKREAEADCDRSRAVCLKQGS